MKYVHMILCVAISWCVMGECDQLMFRPCLQRVGFFSGPVWVENFQVSQIDSSNHVDLCESRIKLLSFNKEECEFKCSYLLHSYDRELMYTNLNLFAESVGTQSVVKCKKKYDEIVEFSGLGDFIKLPVKNYSAGMKAKLGFSIATIVNPDILIIDEVLGVGDINFRKKSREKLQELMESGTTVLLVSHSIEEIRRICDTAIWIDQGKLRDYGEVNLIVDKYIEDAKQTGKIKNKRQRLR